MEDCYKGSGGCKAFRVFYFSGLVFSFRSFGKSSNEQVM